MHLEKQIIHTPSHFFHEKDGVWSKNVGQANHRTSRNRLFTPDNILLERRDFHIRVADTQDRQQQASALMNQMYAWRGYRLAEPEPQSTGNRATLQACQGKETLGTLTLAIDSARGLLADALYREEIDALRMRGGVVCELTGFAVRAGLGSNELLASLFHLLHIFGHRLHRATDAVIEVNPRHALYYERLLGFRQIGDRRICGRVDAPAVLLHIETDFVEEQIVRHTDNQRRAGRSLYPYFLSRQETESLSQRLQELS